MLKKYKMSLIVIIILVGSLLLIGGGYLLYRYNVNKNSAIVIVEDSLSINYLNGTDFKIKKKEKEIPFSIINDADDDVLFDIKLLDVETDGKKITYDLIENNKKIKTNEKIKVKSELNIASYVTISGLETKSYKLVIHNPEKEKITFKLKITKVSEENSSFAQVILNSNSINKETKTEVGEELAVSDEGLVLDVDDSGNTYYFRGAVANNYFKLGDKMWRIVKVNGNGTVKLVLDSTIQTSTMYDDSLSGDRLGSVGNIYNLNSYTTLNNWYNENLKDYDAFISEEKFCIDTNKEGDNLNNYTRINVSNIPTFNCLGTNNNSKIGLLTVDEIIYAGATIDGMNNNFYLYNPEITTPVWTYSPARDGYEGIYFYELLANGTIATSSTGESTKGLRPVINIKKDVEVTGKVTKEEPYTIK